MDVIRGRYRNDPAHPTPVPANQPVTYEFALPNVDYVVQPGHRLMVQVQSSWFPLYDRNPQTFVPNIFFAKPPTTAPRRRRVFTGTTAAGSDYRSCTDPRSPAKAGAQEPGRALSRIQ